MRQQDAVARLLASPELIKSPLIAHIADVFAVFSFSVKHVLSGDSARLRGGLIICFMH